MTAVAAPNASTELLQHLIRLECVNTGHPDSGDETRAAELLRSVVDVPGVDLQVFGPMANRQSLVARLPGTDPTAPTLLLLGGVAVGVLLALVSRLLVAGTARGRARSADKRLREAIDEVAQDLVVAPIEAELAAYAQAREGLAQALR